jgi:hypothetical protein
VSVRADIPKAVSTAISRRSVKGTRQVMDIWKTNEFEFEVGDTERHSVRYHFNQTLGGLRIWVDDRLVLRKFKFFSLSTTSRYEFAVGTEERHNVAIEQSRQWVVGGLRAQTCTTFVDGLAVGTY